MDAKTAIKHHRIAEEQCAEVAMRHLKEKDYADAARWAGAAQGHKFAARQIKLIFKDK